MKSVLTVLVFAIFFVISGCGNDSATTNDNNLDSVAASDSPNSTSVLTGDSTGLKEADTTNNH